MIMIMIVIMIMMTNMTTTMMTMMRVMRMMMTMKVMIMMMMMTSCAQHSRIPEILRALRHQSKSSLSLNSFSAARQHTAQVFCPLQQQFCSDCITQNNSIGSSLMSVMFISLGKTRFP